MGLSTKQVPGDIEAALDWNNRTSPDESAAPPPPVRRQQQSEPVNCPRCGSTNTKFCYYNNYNKSQPRHFCKACKRHWTKGGTLRNVPVGGGRKNKRIKASTTTAPTSTTSCSTYHRNNNHALAAQNSQQEDSSPNFPLSSAAAVGDPKNISDHHHDILYQALISSSSVRNDPINAFASKTFKSSCGPTVLSPPHQNLQFSSSSLNHPLESISSPIPSFNQSLSLNNSNRYDLGDSSMESSTIMDTGGTSSTIFSQAWQLGPTTSCVEVPNYWNWNEIDTLVSADLNIPWDDSEIKP